MKRFLHFFFAGWLLLAYTPGLAVAAAFEKACCCKKLGFAGCGISEGKACAAEHADEEEALESSDFYLGIDEDHPDFRPVVVPLPPHQIPAGADTLDQGDCASSQGKLASANARLFLESDATAGLELKTFSSPDHVALALPAGFVTLLSPPPELTA